METNALTARPRSGTSRLFLSNATVLNNCTLSRVNMYSWYSSSHTRLNRLWLIYSAVYPSACSPVCPIYRSPLPTTNKILGVPEDVCVIRQILLAANSEKFGLKTLSAKVVSYENPQLRKVRAKYFAFRDHEFLRRTLGGRTRAITHDDTLSAEHFRRAV